MPVIFLTLAILSFCFYFFRDPFAGFLWREYRLAYAASLLNASDAPLALELGNYYFNVYGDGAYDLNLAEQNFKKAIASDPLVPDAWHQRARIDFLRGNFSGALQKINTQIELHGDSLMSSYYIRGLIYGYSGELPAAEADFKKFLAWDPTNWAAHNDLAWVYFRGGKYAETERIAKEGLASSPNNPWLLTSIGIALLNENRKAEARTYLERAQKEAGTLTEADWQRAYPGNNPAIAVAGLEQMRGIIQSNLALLNE